MKSTLAVQNTEQNRILVMKFLEYDFLDKRMQFSSLVAL